MCCVCISECSVTGHHKSKDSLAHCSAILKWYYSIYVLFGYCCVGAELFYVLLYVHYYFPSELVWNLCMYGCLPACVIKNFINVVQLHDAARTIAAHDAHDWNKEH
jgi:CDP-diacylglycerol--inositol 3-phosphatidyltransferase